MMRQFQGAVPGYRVRWGRMSLLLIAMSAPIRTGSQAEDEKELLSRLAAYKDPARLADILTRFTDLPMSIMVGLGPVQVDMWAVAKMIVKGLGLSGRHPERAWSAELEWLAPPGKQAQPQAALQKLIWLSRISGVDNPEADGLLMNAFLSDLAESAARIRGRPYNFLLLLDNADSDVGWDFLEVLGRTRREDYRGDYDPDPLVVVAAGGGARWLEMPDAAPEGRPVSAVQPGDVDRIRLEGLSWEHMPGLLAEYPLPRGADRGQLKPARVRRLVYRLTAGHCLASRLMLGELRRDPEFAGSLDQFLGEPWTESLARPDGTSVVIPDEEVSQRVLNSVVRGLTPERTLTGSMLRDLVTLAAARHVHEARQLRGLLLTTDRDARQRLFCDVLWAHSTPDGDPAMLPVARHLLLRELASRDPASLISWESVFRTLQERAAEPHSALRAVAATPQANDGRTNDLHHLLATGRITEVVSVLTAMVPSADEPEWLACLDAVTVTAAPARLVGPVSPEDSVTGLRRTVHFLTDAHQRLSDRWSTNAEQLRELYRRTGYAYVQLIEYAPADWRIIGQRADYYLALAREIA